MLYKAITRWPPSKLMPVKAYNIDIKHELTYLFIYQQYGYNTISPCTDLLGIWNNHFAIYSFDWSARSTHLEKRCGVGTQN